MRISDSRSSVRLLPASSLPGPSQGVSGSYGDGPSSDQWSPSTGVAFWRQDRHADGIYNRRRGLGNFSCKSVPNGEDRKYALSSLESSFRVFSHFHASNSSGGRDLLRMLSTCCLAPRYRNLRENGLPSHMPAGGCPPHLKFLGLDRK
jgi:hypothetical protein